MFLEILQNPQENTCARGSFLAYNFIKKDALAQVFFCEFCKISESTFFTEHLWATASEFPNLIGFFSLEHDIFIIKKLFYSITVKYTSSELLSFLHR